MKARELIKKLMNEQSITNAEMARKLGITQQAMYERTKTSKGTDLRIAQLADTLEELGYALVVVPKSHEDDLPSNSYKITTHPQAQGNNQLQKVYTLTTSEGEVWKFSNKEDARRSQYIFGGKITESEITCSTSRP